MTLTTKSIENIAKSVRKSTTVAISLAAVRPSKMVSTLPLHVLLLYDNMVKFCRTYCKFTNQLFFLKRLWIFGYARFEWIYIWKMTVPNTHRGQPAARHGSLDIEKDAIFRFEVNKGGKCDKNARISKLNDDLKPSCFGAMKLHW